MSPKETQENATHSQPGVAIPVQGTLEFTPPSSESREGCGKRLHMLTHIQLFWQLLRTQSVLPLILCTAVFLITLLWIMPVSIRNNFQSLGGETILVADVDAEITALSLKLGVASIAILVLTGMLLWRVFRWSLKADSERIRAERALANTNECLEQANARLQNKQRQLEGFLYAVSHDLKAPLISIQGFATLLRGEMDTAGNGHPGDTKHALRYFDRIDRNIRSMESLLADLMTLSRIGRIEEEAEPVSLREIAEEVIEENAAELMRKAIRAECDPDLPAALGRRNRLRQLLANLVNNAVKYMPPKEDAQIFIGYDRKVMSPRGGRGAHFVQDNGPGIEPAIRERVFDLFQRGLNPEAREGSGLGLAIVRDIAESHGGCVWVASEPGLGSTFYFRLPAAPTEAALAGTGPAGAGPTGAGPTEAALTEAGPLPDVPQHRAA